MGSAEFWNAEQPHLGLGVRLAWLLGSLYWGEIDHPATVLRFV